MNAYQGFPAACNSFNEFQFPVMPGFESVAHGMPNGVVLDIRRVSQDGYCAKFSYKIEREGHILRSGSFHALGGLGSSMEQEFHKAANQLIEIALKY